MPVSSRSYLLCGVALYGALVGTVLFARQSHVAQPLRPESARAHGPVNAPVQIDEFSDFQCPACRDATRVLHELVPKYGARIRLTFYHFPLRIHAQAEPAHKAAQCAAEQGKFWPYHEILFEKQPEWVAAGNPRELFGQYALKAGLDGARFSACLDQPGALETVKRDMEIGKSRHVQSTPTYFVNGRIVIGGSGFEKRFEAAIRDELGLSEPKSP